MQLPDEAPKLPKLPFLIGDGALLATAWFIADRSEAPLSPAALLAIVGCVALGAILAVIPFIAEYARRQEEALQERQNALEALSRTTATAAEQIGIAANGLHTIAELAQKNLKLAEQLGPKLQERINEFARRNDEALLAENEALTQEVNALRASEAEKLEAAADKMRLGAVELGRLEAATQEHLATINDRLARLPALAEEAARIASQIPADATRAQIARLLAEIDTHLAARLSAAAAAAATPASAPVPLRTSADVSAEPTASAGSSDEPPVASAAVAPAPAASAEGAAEPPPPAVTPTPPEPKRKRTKASPPPRPVESDAPAAVAAPEPTPTQAPVPEPTPAAAPAPVAEVKSEPTVAPTPRIEDEAISRQPESVPADSPAEPVVTAASLADAAAEPTLEPVAESASPAHAPAPTPEPAPSEAASVDAAASAAPTTESVVVADAAAETAPNAEADPESAPPKPVRKPKKAAASAPPFIPGLLNTDAPVSRPYDDLGDLESSEPSGPPVDRAISADGRTRLLATAYIGIGNKLFIRGDGPGLSWDKGVPLQFVSIGKWRWETADATASFSARLYKNDQVECATLGTLTLDPGQQTEVQATF